MITASELADLLDRKQIAAAVGVLPTAVSNAVVRGKFPAPWFIVLSEMAKAKGLNCPPELFNLIIPNTPNVDSGQHDQGL